MATETDLATAVATELVKQVPIKEAYQDGLSPAVRNTGSALADFVKTLRLASYPLRWITRSSSGCTHLQGVISRASVTEIVTGG